MHIALVGVLDEPALAVSVDDAVTVVGRVRAAVRENLHRAPMLRRVLWPSGVGAGGPIWVDAPSFDLGRHVVLARADLGPTGRRILPRVGVPGDR
jgi:hypothetical protein